MGEGDGVGDGGGFFGLKPEVAQKNMEQIITKAGFPCDIFKATSTDQGAAWEEEQARLVSWIQSLPKPVGIMACNDERGLQVVPLTPLDGLRVTHEMTLVEGDCTNWDEGWRLPELRQAKPARRPEIVLRGTWPAGCERTVAINVVDRDDFIARHVRALWKSLGGTWRGKVREGVAPADAQLHDMARPQPVAQAKPARLVV